MGRAERMTPIDGRRVQVANVRVRSVGQSFEVELTLAEGCHRIVRRLAEVLGLAAGPYRRLAAHEIEAIEHLHATA